MNIPITQKTPADSKSSEQAEAENDKAKTAAKALDRLREKIGPIGVPVSDLIAEGRRR